MTRNLPSRPSLEHLKHQARDLQRDHQANDPAALDRVEAHLPGHRGRLSVARAQTVVAREYGVASWPQLKTLVETRLLELHRTEASRAAGLPGETLDLALESIRTLDGEGLERLLRAHPQLASVQVDRARGSNLLHEACRVDPAALGRPASAAIAIVERLLAAGIDLNAPYSLPEGGDLYAAWFCRSNEVLRYVLEHGGKPSGMYGAAYSENAERIRLLHRHGGDLEQVVHDETPLLHAFKNRKPEATRILLELGADVNHADSKGATALHYAVRQYAEPEAIALLLRYGATPELRTKRGSTPVDLARRLGRNEVAALLGGTVEPLARPERPGDVHLRPFHSIDGSLLEEMVAFYEQLGFTCASFQPDHGFASLSLGGATLLVDSGGAGPTVEAVIYLCGAEVLSAVRSAVERGAIAHTVTTSELRLEDPSGLQAHFVAEEGRTGVEAEARLSVADMSRARAFYARVGFAEVEDAVMQLGSSRVHLVEDRSAGKHALGLWLTCEDFDEMYLRVGSRLEVQPPEVAFFGEILFGVTDPDGHRLTFSAPATDI
jgi:uncharacterized glyoxalase superfamily protein PhnB